MVWVKDTATAPREMLVRELPRVWMAARGDTEVACTANITAGVGGGGEDALPPQHSSNWRTQQWQARSGSGGGSGGGGSGSSGSSGGSGNSRLPGSCPRASCAGRTATSCWRSRCQQQTAGRGGVRRSGVLVECRAGGGKLEGHCVALPPTRCMLARAGVRAHQGCEPTESRSGSTAGRAHYLQRRDCDGVGEGLQDLLVVAAGRREGQEERRAMSARGVGTRASVLHASFAGIILCCC